MSRVFRVFAFLSLFAAPTLRAQGSADARAQAKVVDSLVAMWGRAMVELRRFDDSVFVRYQPDTLRISHMTVLVDRVIRPRVEPLVRAAAAEIDRVAGDNAAGLSKRYLTVRRLRETDTDTVVVSARGKSGNEVMENWGSIPDSTIVQWLVKDAIWLLSDDLDRSFAVWLSMELKPDTETTVSMSRQRLDLVSANQVVGRLCYQGDLKACKAVLGLVESADPWLEWYDQKGRQSVVKQLSRRLQRIEWASADRCIDGSDADCLLVLREAGMFRPTLSPSPRQSLAKLAMQLGGAGGYGRMLSSKGSPAERIASAAGMPIDDVVKQWQRRVVTTRAPQVDMTPGIAVASLGWVLVCGVLSLRSSRWR